jgi:hypothetical protein
MSVNYFGVRHLSPSGAWHLHRFLDGLRPDAVLVEGPSDANALIPHLTAPGTVPPVAMLAYTAEPPVRTVLWPFAVYSPEYQALLWAKENGAHAAFIDLPSSVFLAAEYAGKDAGENAPEGNAADIYARWAELAGEADHETYWERRFEHNLNPGAYRLAAAAFGRALRAVLLEDKYESARTMLREAHMKRGIEEARKAGHERIAVVAGAYHVPALESAECAALSDGELEKLPRRASNLTLMPYSYFRMSTRGGYGAGNRAPAYYEMLWHAVCRGDLEGLAGGYFSAVAAELRSAGNAPSAAECIEGVRLARTLAALHEGSAPALADLRDAAVACLGRGDFANIAGAAARVEIGAAVGTLPEGAARTSIQDDFYRELGHLKLGRYRTAVASELDLDLREDRRVKSGESAFLDLRRSFFLHRLAMLEVPFARPLPSGQQSATWAERWALQWTPEAEISLVESALRGDTVETAAAYAFKEKLDACAGVDNAAALIRRAGECGLPSAMEYARSALQRLAAVGADFAGSARALAELSAVVRYGSVRRLDTAPLLPLLAQLFLRASLLLVSASACDDRAASDWMPAMHALNAVSLEHAEAVDSEAWLKALRELASRDDCNARLSGFACALLLERGLMGAQDLSREVSRRLSPGIPADVGAGWFEGLALRNRAMLLSRVDLWKRLDGYVASLDEGQFRRALVFLRRGFSDFSPADRRAVARILGEVWGVGGEEADEYLSGELSETEIKKLEEFDFGDL